MNSKQSKKLLLLSGALGDGHNQAAYALMEALRSFAPHIEAASYDFIEVNYPKVHRLAKYVYMQGVQKLPSVYGFLYHKTRHAKSMVLWKKSRFLGLGKLVELLETEQPDAIVCTFPLAAAAVSLLKTNGLIDLPLITVITDHTDHSYWIHPFTDTYIVGSEKVRQALLSLHIPENRIVVTGIPVRQAFEKQFNRQSLREKYGLSPHKTTMMVMGGGCGMIADELLDLLTDSMRDDLQWIIICGHNRKLFHHLQNRLNHAASRVKIYGYMDNIHEWMALSDILITKPGGLTTSEAIALGLPMLLFQTLPGQEQDNAEYYVNSGAAVYAANESELSVKLLTLIDTPDQLEHMRLQALRIRPHQPGYAAVHTICEAMNHPADIQIASQTGRITSYLYYTR